MPNRGDGGVELAGARLKYWQTIWEVQRCNIGRRIGRCNELAVELGGETVRIGRSNGAELGGELGDEWEA
jgi:hypothetical protein